MMWNGLKNLNWKYRIKNMKLKHKVKTQIFGLNSQLLINLNKPKICFYLPPQWDLLIFKLKQRNNFFLSYAYSISYYFYLPFNFNEVKFYYDNFSKILNVQPFYINNFFALYWCLFKNIFYSFSKVFFKKLKFKGKGYYIYKTPRNTIGTQFGYSHMTRIFGYNTSLKFTTKTIILIYGINKFDVLIFGKRLFNKRPHNIFTGKGVRFSKQIIYKKTGKISSYR
jgi:ribosomal protein L6P/L9E